jgi:peptidoglycan/LPS O-acetylase OafA/YrhL
LQKKAEIPQLTGIRGLAASLVLFWHLREYRDGVFVHFGFLDPFPSYGYLGVDVFFLLSGFILSYAYGEWFVRRLDPEKLFRFFLARLARLYPIHILSLLLMLAAATAGHALFHFTPHNDASYTLPSVVTNLFLVQEWFRTWLGTGSPNPVAWSISVEMASYLLFPFALALSSRLPRWWPFAGFAITYLVLLVFDVRLVKGVAEFYFGFSAYALLNTYKCPSLPRWATLAALVVPFLVAYFARTVIWIVLLPLFCLAVTGIAYNGNDWLSRIARSRPVLYLGEISYSLYMMQWFVWVLFKHALPHVFPWINGHPWLLIAAAALVILAVSSATYRYVEMPGRRWIVKTCGNLYPHPARPT